ncbi:hypothetical protein HMPREF0290_0066 [Corynebacterium efficiens YS-314]|uniref:hypothetical protein n=1 Tax=Corynebacterium efficiens TaxID=152794 RepID=UPI0001B86C64|nr:hypothetical protein [Corynebacterium efficiens]EEW51329.1 hypothetical protein HMPREF0290_0066 [Corynebacterium efficiens YS-314]
MLGIILLVLAVVAALAGRGTIAIPGFGQDDNAAANLSGQSDLTTIQAVVGSEKKAFFEDPGVRNILAEHGYRVEVTAAGSRRIATDTDLTGVDLAFPSSAPAAQKLLEKVTSTGEYTPFNSPIAVATFEPVITVLERAGVARQDNGHWYIDMVAYRELAQEGTRWRDLGEEFPSPGRVQLSSTDVRTSNSAAMYLSLLSWAANDGAVVAGGSEATALVSELSPFFLGQGYTESTSAGPFADYLSQGMGSKPMVVIYEAQFLRELAAEDGRIQPGDGRALAYPYPTVFTKHTAVGLTGEGAEVGRLLAEDPQLQQLAARHGFRPQDAQVFTRVMPELGVDGVIPDQVPGIDPPDYDTLETLIEGVAASYSPVGGPESSPEDEQ